ncbi:MAG: phage head-tail adapter protein [Lachnospiraceae bacterium]
MNKDWSEKNKEIQRLLGKKLTYAEGINRLIEFRKELFAQITYMVNGLPKEAFYQMPYAKAKGYHSKTLSYSIWHVFRIEDIVAHTLMQNDEQILFSDNYLNKIGTKHITTGNELQGEQIAEFSKELDVKALYAYADAVRQSTDEILRGMDYSDFKRKFGDSDRKRVILSECISSDEEACWLVDYWCGKDVLGLIKMPFSRHWIMHIEAMLRIKKNILSPVL